MNDSGHEHSRFIKAELKRYNTGSNRRVHEEFRGSQVARCVLDVLDSGERSDTLELLEGYGHCLKDSPPSWLLADIKENHNRGRGNDITESIDDITALNDDVIESPDDITAKENDISNSTTTKCYVDLISKLVSFADLPKIGMNEDEDYMEEAFVDYPLKASVAMDIITSLVSAILRSSSSLELHWRKEFMNTIVIDCVILSAAHAEKYQWSNKTTIKHSQGLLEVICQACSCNSVHELLSGSPYTTDTETEKKFEKGIFDKILTKLRPKLTRDTWKMEPRSRHVFKWCMSKVKHPNLGDYLDKVLPPSLLFLDDYQVENKILGIQCLHHIILNVDPTELKWYGRAMVIYEAIHKQLYSQEDQLLDVLYPCLIDLLKVIERSPRKADKPRKTTRYDDLLQITLDNMAFEQKIVLRRVYSKHLHLFVAEMGVTIVRHYKKLLQVIANYLVEYDGPDETARLQILNVLSTVTMETWPRISHHVDMLLKSLLRLMCEITADRSTSPEKVKQKLMEGAVNCLILLRRCCRDDIDKALNDVLIVIDNDIVIESIRTVLNDKQSDIKVS